MERIHRCNGKISNVITSNEQRESYRRVADFVSETIVQSVLDDMVLHYQVLVFQTVYFTLIISN